MSSKLVIVESPTKAKTISKYLGKGFKLTSSFGHIRDLPTKEMGIDIKDGTFEPSYVIPKEKAKLVKQLKELAKNSAEVIFATDGDREGEAISWHLANVLKIKPEKAKRIVFHEITKHAIEEALEKPRHIDQNLVDAQQARRVLDRLVGYELSPFLWKKVARGLSAGRVQSVAVRLVVEREREIQNFKSEEYWSLLGIFLNKDKQEISAKLAFVGDKKIDRLDLKNQKEMDKILDELKDKKFKVSNIEKKEEKRTPPPPFTTSTLQQKANQSLGFSSKQTMQIAQQLYEGVELGEHGTTGLITYMRTDSVNLSEKFVNEALEFIEKKYGKEYLETRKFKTKSKTAQEAHEAIRPTHISLNPELIKSHLSPQQYKLYNLIWKRAAATQMASAKLNKTVADISEKKYTFRANGQTIIFDGWLKLYPQKIKEESMPELKMDEKLDAKEFKPEQHFTEPPARYSDATLVKVMEEHEIGRPSTYAPTISTIETRKYIERDENKKLKPTEIAFVVNDLLTKHFPKIVDLSFTAKMEKNLDAIAEGEEKWLPIIKEFYEPFHTNLVHKNKEISKKEIIEEKTKEKCDKCGSPMVIKLGRFGKFLACSNYPECKNTKPISDQEKQEQKEVQKMHEKCDKCGKPMVLKQGRFGAFLGCSGYPECKNIKPFEKKLGVPCDKCDKGEMIEKKSKKGRIFYACDQYPKCKNALWNKPTGEKCPKCKSMLVEAGKDKIKCSNKECDYEKTAS